MLEEQKNQGPAGFVMAEPPRIGFDIRSNDPTYRRVDGLALHVSRSRFPKRAPPHPSTQSAT